MEDTIRIKQATRKGFIECAVGGGSGFILPVQQNPKRACARQRLDLSNDYGDGNWHLPHRKD